MADREEPKWGKWGTWQETEALLGKEIGFSQGADEVEKGSIRRWLETKEFDCPLHYDDKVAQKAGYQAIIAPCTMVTSYGVAAYWKSEDAPTEAGDSPKQIPLPVLDNVPAPCTLSFASDIEMEFISPIYIGDRLTSESKLVNILRKEIRVGKGAFLLQETTYKNQREEVVAILRMNVFRFSPQKKKED